VVLPQTRFFKRVNLQGATLGEWPVLEPFLDADRLINVPIAKHHSLTGVTLGMKNWYGSSAATGTASTSASTRGIVDLTAFAKPTLTVMDAYRVLMRNGPTGGDVDDVEMKRAVVASVDPVAVDAYAAQAWVEPGRAAPCALPAARRRAGPRKDGLRVAQDRGGGRLTPRPPTSRGTRSSPSPA